MGLLGIAFKIVIVLLMIRGIITLLRLLFSGVIMGGVESIELIDKLITPRANHVKKPLFGLKISHEEDGEVIKSKTI